MNATDALAQLRDSTQATVSPVLTDAELGRLLRRAQAADADGNAPDDHATWAGTTAYALGYVVVPTVRDGFAYAATTAGTSGASEPDWPAEIDETVADGSVVWTCVEVAPWTPTYDGGRLNSAAAEGWRLKAGKLGAGESFSADGASFDPDKRRAFCLAMAKEYRNKVAGTAATPGRVAQGQVGYVVGTVAN